MYYHITTKKSLKRDRKYFQHFPLVSVRTRTENLRNGRQGTAEKHHTSPRFPCTAVRGARSSPVKEQNGGAPDSCRGAGDSEESLLRPGHLRGKWCSQLPTLWMTTQGGSGPGSHSPGGRRGSEHRAHPTPAADPTTQHHEVAVATRTL